MEASALEKNIRVSPRKVRLVADAVRGLPYAKAVEALSVLGKRAAFPLSRALQSAAGNASSLGMDRKNLIIKKIEVMEGQKLKRYNPSSRGRVLPYLKRASHIKIILSDDKTQISTQKKVDKDVQPKKEDENGTKS